MSLEFKTCPYEAKSWKMLESLDVFGDFIISLQAQHRFLIHRGHDAENTLARKVKNVISSTFAV